MDKPRFVIDLHTHSTRSDGNDSVAELFQNAAARGLEVIAISDHDIFPPAVVEVGDARLPLRDFADSLGIKVIPAMEVSCDTDVDDVHIVAMGCDWESPLLEWIPALAQTSKVNGYKQVVERLRKSGIDIVWEELTGGGTRADDAVQKKHIFELVAQKGYAASWQAAKMMIRENPNFDIKREKPSPVATIKSIHEAGGVAILAHPYLIDEQVQWHGEPVTRDQYIRLLIESGLDGIETHYTYDKTSYKGNQTPAEIATEVVERYAHLVSILSGGSDYHGDAKKGTAPPRELGDAGIERDYFWDHQTLCALVK
ncbi:MAG: PHP domain-containing protein [Thermoguttaceae bacterium]